MLTVCNGKILPPKIPSLRYPQGIANLHKTVIFTCIFKEKLIFHFSCLIFCWKTKNRKRARMKFFVFVATHTHNSQLIGIFSYYPKYRDQLLEIWLISHMFLKDQSLAIFFWLEDKRSKIKVNYHIQKSEQMHFDDLGLCLRENLTNIFHVVYHYSTYYFHITSSMSLWYEAYFGRHMCLELLE